MMEEISREEFLSQPPRPRPHLPQPSQSFPSYPPPQTSEPATFPQPQTLTAQYLRTLSASISGHAASATFACGGFIPLSPWSSHGAYSKPVETQKEKVTLRWDSRTSISSSPTTPLREKTILPPPRSRRRRERPRRPNRRLPARDFRFRRPRRSR